MVWKLDHWCWALVGRVSKAMGSGLSIYRQEETLKLVVDVDYGRI